MLNYNFNIKNYNWNVEVYYYITHFEIDDIDNKLRELACKGRNYEVCMDNIINNSLNTGMIYSNYNKRKSIIVIANTTSPSQFINSWFHEVTHLVAHICDVDKIDFCSEEAAYLSGNIAQEMYLYSKTFLCNCYGNKRYNRYRDAHFLNNGHN